MCFAKREIEEKKKEEATLPTENEPYDYKKHKAQLGDRKGENLEKDQ